MGTNCKLVYGYKDHMDTWIPTESYYRHYDSYPEAMLPLLKEHQADLTTMNNTAEYEGHKFEALDSFYDGVTGVDYIYYIDTSNNSHLNCTVLSLDMDFYNHYGIDNYKIIKECTL